MKGHPWRSLEMVSILKGTLHDLQPGLIDVYYCTVLHCIVRFSDGDRVCDYLSFIMEDVDGVFRLHRIH